MRTDVGGVADAGFHQVFAAGRECDINVEHAFGILPGFVKLHGHDH